MDHYYPEPVENKKLPNDVAVLVLGIVSVVMCGVGFVTGIIALVLSKRSLRELSMDPLGYSSNSISFVKSGRICAIIGVCLHSCIILFYLVYFGFVFSLVSGGLMNQ